MVDRYDVAVIGAGPAGTIAAKLCAEQGLKTVLVEKQSIPRIKPCGGGISVKALRLIKESIPDSLIEQNVMGFRFFSKSLDSVELRATIPIGISTSRDKFDAFLVGLAVDSGSELVQSNPLIDISMEKDGIFCKLKKNRLFRTSLIVGADGANSIVAQKTGIRQKWAASEVGLCLETSMPLDKEEMKQFDPEIFELYFTDIPLGYGWFFPKKASVSLGIGGAIQYLHRPLELLANFCKTLSDLKKLDLHISSFHAHLAPAGGFRRKTVSDRVMLTGDAAGFIDPFTGEGIYYAMRSGQFAAKACIEAIEKSSFEANFLTKQYAKACEDDFGKDLRVALKIAYRIHNHFDTFFNALQQSSSGSWADLACGNTTYSVLQKKLLPKLLLHMVKRKIQKLS
jgi:geranylgeranyl reductase family protein